MEFETIDINEKKGFQSIIIPDKLKIDDNKVYLKKIGNSIYIIPFHNPWQNLIESLDAFTIDFMYERNQPENQKRDSFD